MQGRRSTATAFTLIELLVVIAIVAMLLGILTPSLRKARASADKIRCAQNLRQVFLAITLYTNSNDLTYPCAQDPVSTKPYYWLWMGRGWRRFVQPYLQTQIDPNNPSVLLCPVDRKAREKYESTSYGYSMAFYHSPQQINQMNSPADTYQNPQPSIPQRTVDVARPAQKILVGEWLSNHSPIAEDKGWWCWQGARNYLFADGQILFLNAEQIRPARDDFPDINLTFDGIKGRDWPR